MLDLSRLGRRSYVSQNALAEILKAVRDADTLPTGTSRSAVKRARQRAVAVQTPYGSLVKEWHMKKLDGTQVAIKYLCPAATLWQTLQSCERFREHWARAHEERPCTMASKWSLILYSDEVSPGNQLKANNRRRLQTFYWTVKELGPKALSSEDAWMVLTTVRSATVSELQDGLSQVTKEAILSFFAVGRDFGHGLSMPLTAAVPMMLCCDFSMIVADESALKHMLECKGAGGKLPCLFCRNCIQKRYAPNPLHPDTVLHTCTDTSKFIRHTDATVYQLVDQLAARKPHCNKGEFETLQTNLGFNHCPEGALLCQPLRRWLRPITATCYDWMHCYMVSGIFHGETNLLLDKLAKAGVKQDLLNRAFQEFTWPSFIGDKGAGARDVFAKKSSDADFKSSASEALGAYPVLRQLVIELRDNMDMGNEVAGAVDSFLKLCQCLDMLQHTATGEVASQDLAQAIKSHLDTFQAIYPDASFVPKAHFAMHLPEQLEKHGCLIGCFVHERRHKELKRFANQQCDSREGTEGHLLQEMILTHWDALDRQSLQAPAGLQTPKPASEALQRAFCHHFGLSACPGLLFSGKATLERWPLLKTGDVVRLHPEGVAEVLFHCMYADMLLTCVSLYEPTKVPNHWRITKDQAMFFQVSSIKGPCIFRAKAGVATVLACR